MGKTKRGAVVTVKKRGIAGADKRSERIASKNAANKKQYGKPCNYESREERDFASMLESVGMYVKVMEGDGNCMFRSIADQLFGSLVGHIHIRMQVVDYMVKEKDNFSLFVEDDETFDDYISRMRNEREWGGHQELYAAAQTYHVNIYVHQVDGPRFIVASDSPTRNIHLSYHGEYHYNSIRRVDDRDDGPAAEIILESSIGKENADKNKWEASKSTYDWRKIQRALKEAASIEHTNVNDVTPNSASVLLEDDSGGVSSPPLPQDRCCSHHRGTLCDDVLSVPPSEGDKGSDTVGKRPHGKFRKRETKQIAEKTLSGISKKDKRKILREIARGGCASSADSVVDSGNSNNGLIQIVAFDVVEIHL